MAAMIPTIYAKGSKRSIWIFFVIYLLHQASLEAFKQTSFFLIHFAWLRGERDLTLIGCDRSSECDDLVEGRQNGKGCLWLFRLFTHAGAPATRTGSYRTILDEWEREPC